MSILVDQNTKLITQGITAGPACFTPSVATTMVQTWLEV
jgi:hypothetical protein